MENTTLVKQLWKEFFSKLGISVLLFAGFFLLLYLIEYFIPSLKGQFLQWYTPSGINWAFIVGIPASVIGVAYVLTIKNPQNYVGFYPGILMSLLLAVQFYLQTNYDLTVLYVAVFVPFQIMSLLNWRKATLNPSDGKDEAFAPDFLNIHGFARTFLLSLLIMAIDYVIATKVMSRFSAPEIAEIQAAWDGNIIIKLASGLLIASSFFANYWMIYKKNDAWLCWVLYSIAGIILYIITQILKDCSHCLQ